jgi:hypothetical protein
LCIVSDIGLLELAARSIIISGMLLNPDRLDDGFIASHGRNGRLGAAFNQGFELFLANSHPGDECRELGLAGCRGCGGALAGLAGSRGGI